MYRKGYLVARNRIPTSGPLFLGRTANGIQVCATGEMLDTHWAVLGRTGSGKTTILKHVCEGLVRGGHNLVVIDPHMDLGSFCLSLLPERTLYISPRPVEVGGVQKALAMPVIGSSRDPELQSSLLKDVIVSSQDGVWGPRLQVIMRVLLSRFIQAGSTDLAAFAKTLLDRNALIRAVGDTEEPLLAQFIREITQDWKSWREYSSSTLNRLIPIVSDRGMLHIVSGRPGYDMGQMLWRGSVFVVDTSMIPRDTARVLAGLVLLSIFSHCASERPGRKTFVVVDEAHSVSQSVLETLLREGRKFNLHLILSTQFIRRDEPLYASVVNNCRTFVLFSLSGPEAAAVSGATGISGLEPVLSSMPSLTALLYSTAGPEPVGPVTFSTAPVHGANLAVDAIRRSVELYGTPLASPGSDGPSLHEYMVRALSSILSAKGIPWNIGRSVRGRIPDLTFDLDGREFVVEVEVSDLDRKSRVVGKMASYAGRDVVFLCDTGRVQDLCSILERPVEVREKSGLWLEIPAVLEGREIRFRDLGDFASHVWVLSFSSGRFYLHRSGRQVPFQPEDLLGDAPMISKMRSSFSGFPEAVWRLMVGEGQPAMAYSYVEEKVKFSSHVKAAFRSKVSARDVLVYSDLTRGSF